MRREERSSTDKRREKRASATPHPLWLRGMDFNCTRTCISSGDHPDHHHQARLQATHTNANARARGKTKKDSNISNRIAGTGTQATATSGHHATVLRKDNRSRLRNCRRTCSGSDRLRGTTTRRASVRGNLRTAIRQGRCKHLVAHVRRRKVTERTG